MQSYQCVLSIDSPNLTGSAEAEKFTWICKSNWCGPAHCGRILKKNLVSINWQRYASCTEAGFLAKIVIRTLVRTTDTNRDRDGRVGEGEVSRYTRAKY